MTITFMTADQGDLVLSSDDGKTFACRTARAVTKALHAAGGPDPTGVLRSSSVDFAREYGFRTHRSAYDRWHRGLAQYEQKVQKRAS